MTETAAHHEQQAEWHLRAASEAPPQDPTSPAYVIRTDAWERERAHRVAMAQAHATLALSMRCHTQDRP
jgi:hypothetical protein